MPAKVADEAPAMRWHHYALDTAAGTRRDERRSRSTSSTARGASATRAPTRSCSRTARSSIRASRRIPRSSRASATTRAPSSVGQRPQEVRPRAAAAHARPRRQGAPPAERADARRRLHRVSRDGVHGGATSCRSRPATSSATGPRTAAAASRTGWTRRWPPFYPFVSARYAVKRDVWKGPDGDVAHRDRLPPGPRVQPRPDDRGRQGLARLLHEALRPVPAPDRAHRRVPALLAQGGFAESFPNTVPFNEAIGFTAKVDDRDPEGHRLPVLRDRARGRAPVVGAPGGAGDRAGRRVHHREPVRVLGADGAEEQVRRREDAAVPELRARPLPRRPRRRAEGRAAAPARRRRRLRALPEGRARAVRAAGCDRRGGDGRRAVGVRRVAGASRARRTRRRATCWRSCGA